MTQPSANSLDAGPKAKQTIAPIKQERELGESPKPFLDTDFALGTGHTGGSDDVLRPSGRQCSTAAAQICFPQGSDIQVSNTNVIPNGRIIEKKTFIMISKAGRSNLCEAAMAFMGQVRDRGGNAVIGFSFMTITDATPRTVLVFYGTAVVVEPIDEQLSDE